MSQPNAYIFGPPPAPPPKAVGPSQPYNNQNNQFSRGSYGNRGRGSHRAGGRGNFNNRGGSNQARGGFTGFNAPPHQGQQPQQFSVGTSYPTPPAPAPSYPQQP